MKQISYQDLLHPNASDSYVVRLLQSIKSWNSIEWINAATLLILFMDPLIFLLGSVWLILWTVKQFQSKYVHHKTLSRQLASLADIPDAQTLEQFSSCDTIIFSKKYFLTRGVVTASHLFVDNNYWTVSGKGYDSRGSLFCEGKLIDTDYSETLRQLLKVLEIANKECMPAAHSRVTHAQKGAELKTALSVLAHKLLQENYADEYTLLPAFEKEQEEYYMNGFSCGQKIVVIVIGSIPSIKQFCTIDQRAQEAGIHYSLQGLQVVGVACKELSQSDAAFSQEMFKSMSFLGLIALEDEIRYDLLPVIKRARAQGYQLIFMDSGCQEATIALASEIGLFKDGDEALRGCELSGISDGDLQEQLCNVTVLSHMSQSDKKRVIRLLRERRKNIVLCEDSGDSALAAFGTIIKPQFEKGFSPQPSIISLKEPGPSLFLALELGKKLTNKSQTPLN